MPIGDMNGGLVGGEQYDGDSFENGDAYEGKWATEFIIAGILYYTQQESGAPTQPIVAVDLHTGQTLWTKTFLNNLRPAFGQIIDWKCMNNHGSFAYLWFTSGTTWYAFDALTGEWRFNMTNVPSGTRYYGPLGEMLIYSIANAGNSTNPNWRLAQWNQSYVVSAGKTGMSESWGSQVRGQQYNCSTRPNGGYDWNVSIPALRGTSTPSILKVFPMDRVIGGSVSQTMVQLWGLNLNKSKGEIGTLLFNNTWTPPKEWVEGNISVSGFQSGFAV